MCPLGPKCRSVQALCWPQFRSRLHIGGRMLCVYAGFSDNAWYKVTYQLTLLRSLSGMLASFGGVYGSKMQSKVNF